MKWSAFWWNFFIFPFLCKSLHNKGKVERNFRTLRSRFLNALDPSRIAGIDELNSLLADYIRRHNTSVHSAAGMTPYTRYMEGLSHVRMPVSPQWLDACFLHWVKRRVRNDATVMIDKRLFDVPMEFIRSTVEIRFRPGAEDSAFILDAEKRYSLRPTDTVHISLAVCFRSFQ